MTKGVFLDLCGTLLVYGDMTQAWEQWLDCAYALFRRSGLRLSREEFQKACDGMFSLPEPPPRDDGLTVYERRLQRLARRVNHRLTVPELQNTAMATVRTWADRMYPDPELFEVLETLRQRCRLTLITNYDHPPYIEMVLQQYALRPYFSEVLISSVVGIKKPNPAIFELALRRADLERSEVMHVGDSLADDIQGARAAGIRPVFIRRDSDQTEAAYDYRSGRDSNDVRPHNPADFEVETICRLSELPDLL